MLLHRTLGIKAFQRIMDVTSIQFLFWLSYFLYDSSIKDNPETTLSNLISYGIALLIATVFYAIAKRTDHSKRGLQLGWVESHFKTTEQTTIIVSIWLCILFFLEEQTVSRIFMVLFIVELYIYLLISNKTLSKLLAKLFFNSKFTDETVLIGSKKQIEKEEHWIRDTELIGLQITHRIEAALDNINGSQLDDLLKTIELDLKRFKIKKMILLTLPSDRKVLTEIANLCNLLGVRFLLINDLHEQVGHSLHMLNFNGKALLTLTQEPLENPFNRILKRIFDIIMSIPVVFIILPLVWPIVWIFQRAQSPGPLLVVQTRAGLNNKRFRMLKFRTMHPSDGKDEARQATKGDQRIYPFGRILRKLSLDELPQFINVLQGDMSLIGPRPHLIEHDKLFETILFKYNVRHFIKPGITGLAQVRGHRGEITSTQDLEHRINSDVYYLENWTLGLDCLILVRTIVTMISPPRTAV